MSRLLLIAVLMVILPLRGWMGDAMAMHSVAQVVQMAEAAAEQAMPPDCPMAHHMERQTAHDPAPHMAHQAEPADGPCQGCDNCQLCLPVALLDLPTPPAAHWQAASPAPQRTEAFMSAPAQAGFKPPIS